MALGKQVGRHYFFLLAQTAPTSTSSVLRKRSDATSASNITDTFYRSLTAKARRRHDQRERRRQQLVAAHSVLVVLGVCRRICWVSRRELTVDPNAGLRDASSSRENHFVPLGVFVACIKLKTNGTNNETTLGWEAGDFASVCRGHAEDEALRGMMVVGSRNIAGRSS